MPAATRPLATARTSDRNSAAVTSRQPWSGPSPDRRENTTASAASAALVTTSSVRLPVVGISTFSGDEYSRTVPPHLRGAGPVGGYRRAGGTPSDSLAGPGDAVAPTRLHPD